MEPWSLESMKKHSYWLREVPRLAWRKLINLGWLGQEERSSREFAITNLYSKALYVFSDVLVFVLENPK